MASRSDCIEKVYMLVNWHGLMGHINGTRLPIMVLVAPNGRITARANRKQSQGPEGLRGPWARASCKLEVSVNIYHWKVNQSTPERRKRSAKRHKRGNKYRKKKLTIKRWETTTKRHKMTNKQMTYKRHSCFMFVGGLGRPFDMHVPGGPLSHNPSMVTPILFLQLVKMCHKKCLLFNVPTTLTNLNLVEVAH